MRRLAVEPEELTLLLLLTDRPLSDATLQAGVDKALTLVIFWQTLAHESGLALGVPVRTDAEHFITRVGS